MCRVEGTNVLILFHESHLDCMYAITDLKNRHLIHITLGIASIKVTQSPVLSADRIDLNNLEKCFMAHLADTVIKQCL